MNSPAAPTVLACTKGSLAGMVAVFGTVAAAWFFFFSDENPEDALALGSAFLGSGVLGALFCVPAFNQLIVEHDKLTIKRVFFPRRVVFFSQIEEGFRVGIANSVQLVVWNYKADAKALTWRRKLRRWAWEDRLSTNYGGMSADQLAEFLNRRIPTRESE